MIFILIIELQQLPKFIKKKIFIKDSFIQNP
jgi:hypothetical protein